MAAMVAILDFRSEQFKLFLIYKSPRCFLSSFKSTELWVQKEERKIDFQDGGHLGFPIGMILAIFDLHVTLMLPTKFQVDWSFGSGGEAKNRFSKWNLSTQVATVVPPSVKPKPCPQRFSFVYRTEKKARWKQM